MHSCKISGDPADRFCRTGYHIRTLWKGMEILSWRSKNTEKLCICSRWTLLCGTGLVLCAYRFLRWISKRCQSICRGICSAPGAHWIDGTEKLSWRGISRGCIFNRSGKKCRCGRTGVLCTIICQTWIYTVGAGYDLVWRRNIVRNAELLCAKDVFMHERDIGVRYSWGRKENTDGAGLL